MMMSGNPLQVAILLYGGGGNGKGTVLRVLAKMLGKNNISNVNLKSISENKFALADMFGKIANIAGDIDAKYLNDTAQFKQITGEDTVRAEKKFKDSFAYNPWAVPVFSANKLWRSADDTEGYLRRWIIIPLPTELDRSKDFDENILWAEASGIFNKAIANLQVLIARGKFSPTGSALEVMDEFRTQNDPVRIWLKDESAIYVGLPHSRMLREEVYNNYQWWCVNNGYKPKAKDQLFKSLRNEKFQEQSSNGKRYFLGLYPASEVIVVGETVIRY